MDNKKIRKLSHLSGEDYYYMTYLLILCLNEFSSKKSRVLKDHRKISFLIHIISSSAIVDIINENKEKINVKDKDLLYTSYTKGTIHAKDIYKLILSLEIKGLVKVIKTSNPEILDVKLLDENVPKSFFDKKLFEKELANIVKLKGNFTRLSVTGLNTFIERVYTKKGLRVWVQ